MGEVTVVRWTRYGKDRLYVKAADGTDLGWADARTGEVTASDATHAALVRDAVAPVLDSARTGTSPPSASAEEAAVEPAQDWYDLAQNRPGQAARARADEELAAMRDRSKVGTWLARTLDLKTDERAWRVGADGEETIGGRLDRLTKHGWHVLHSVPVGSQDSDIDHVLIGPGGVYTINTKKHPGKSVWVGGSTAMISGRRVRYIPKAEYEADRAERLLTRAAGFPVAVRPVLIFTTGSLVPDVTIKTRPERVVILDRSDVPGAFKRAPRRLDPNEVETVYTAARRSTSWED